MEAKIFFPSILRVGPGGGLGVAPKGRVASGGGGEPPWEGSPQGEGNSQGRVAPRGVGSHQGEGNPLGVGEPTVGG